MSLTYSFTLEQVQPEYRAVLREQGIPAGAEVPDRIQALYDHARDIFCAVGKPVGIMAQASHADFDQIFSGEAANDPDSLLMKIYPRAYNLALFTLTLGEPVSDKIEHLFANREFALAAMLDSIASLAADLTVERLEQVVAGCLANRGHPEPAHRSLGYSPGYCGWHISGQKKLFAYLQPEEIGITLNDSFLMSPLKSVSGVIVEGPEEIHEFEPNFTFCRTCRTHSCVTRMRHSGKVKVTTT